MKKKKRRSLKDTVKVNKRIISLLLKRKIRRGMMMLKWRRMIRIHDEEHDEVEDPVIVQEDEDSSEEN
jgi:hypothetical protein